ncbi:hypothetical protein NXH76_11890 [Blautia schinkii]|nr:hypothetical protein [Blautia schinkii]
MFDWNTNAAAAVRAQVEQDEADTRLIKVAGEDVGNRLIRIIREQSPLKQLAFTETTIEALAAGYDYSECKTIDDMAHVYAGYLIDLTFGKSPENICMALNEKGVL